MVITRGKEWALSIERPSRWKEMREEPDGVPLFGKWIGLDDNDKTRTWIGYYCFPFAFRTIRKTTGKNTSEIVEMNPPKQRHNDRHNG